MEFAICTDHAVTGDDEWHGVGGIRSTNGAIGIRPADLNGDIVVCASLSIWDSKDYLQRLTLEWAKQSPVNGDGERCAFAIDIFVQLFGIRRDLFRIRLDGTFQALEVRIKL